ncbi:MAG TPA: hypothetical protein VFN36_00455 [Solirubrobacteraceae bacterium]|nr:hypothetical protein [Solirubrobacteraceae bacterium]
MARQEAEADPIPQLQLMPRLEVIADGDGAVLRGGANLRLRTGLIALLVALTAAAAAVLILRAASHPPVALPSVRATLDRERAQARLARAGVRAAVAPILDVTSGTAVRTVGAVPVVPVPHALSAGDLTTLAAGTSLYQPAPYLARAYRTVAARFHIPWRVLASVEYLRGGYVEAVGGANASAQRMLAGQVQANGRDVVAARVLAQASAATAQPSPSLVADAQRLAGAGAAASPARGIAAVMAGTGTSTQAVMTLAQSIAPATSASAPPAAKVGAMLAEARLLNGLPYIWGGGHTNPAWLVGPGYDCSGFVSEVLHSAGYLTSPDTTQTLPGSAGIVSGPGKYVTIYDRTIATVRVWVKRKKLVRTAVNPASAGVHLNRARQADALDSVAITLPKWVGEWKTITITRLVRSLDNSINDEHVIIDIAGQWWESGGDTADGGAAMVHRMTPPSPGYLKSFNRILHPQGL